MKRKITSIKIDEKLWHDEKVRCKEEGIFISDKIESLIKKDLKGD